MLEMIRPHVCAMPLLQGCPAFLLDEASCLLKSESITWTLIQMRRLS